MNKKMGGDFFFGEISIGSGGAKTRYDRVITLAKQVPKAYFHTQLDRVLREAGGLLTLQTSSSRPDLYALMGGIDLSGIGKIEIERRTDVNRNIPCSLGCKIFLEQGVLALEAHWSACREAHAHEIFSSLIIPIHKLGLTEKTFIKWSDTEMSRLSVYRPDYDDEVRDILRLAAADSLVGDNEFISMSVKVLESCTG